MPQLMISTGLEVSNVGKQHSIDQSKFQEEGLEAEISPSTFQEELVELGFGLVAMGVREGSSIELNPDNLGLEKYPGGPESEIIGKENSSDVEESPEEVKRGMNPMLGAVLDMLDPSQQTLSGGSGPERSI